MTATVQACLRHLHAQGFTDAPVPLGVDEQVLTFVPGDIPAEPLPAQCAREEILVALARLVRRLQASLAWAETAAAADPVFQGFWENGWREAMPRAVTWLEQEDGAIERVLLG